MPKGRGKGQFNSGSVVEVAGDGRMVSNPSMSGRRKWRTVNSLRDKDLRGTGNTGQEFFLDRVSSRKG